ncbi:MAG: hypothetical protein ACK56I_04435, partial [bacterium]
MLLPQRNKAAPERQRGNVYARETSNAGESETQRGSVYAREASNAGEREPLFSDALFSDTKSALSSDPKNAQPH